MKIFIICSKRFYPLIPPIQKELEKLGHKLTFPNTYPKTDIEDSFRSLGEKERAEWKATMLRKSVDSVSKNDAVLVLNFDKDDYKNYIGGATFLEMYDAFRLNKKIFLYNQIPEGILKDEIGGFCPIIINGDLSQIK
ncbi:MAG: hypothetical protein PHO75_00695 [Candidatus Shapirobacteria bacterium]|nr:hypothetical protein [Candidatus Shapirobacteria bacterium]